MHDGLGGNSTPLPAKINTLKANSDLIRLGFPDRPCLSLLKLRSGWEESKEQFM